MFDRSQFEQTLAALGLSDPADEFAKLKTAHDEPQRHYHNAQHISDCLRKLRQFRHLAERPEEIALAIWFHDAVYDPTQNDNEERSADWADEFLKSTDAPADLIERVTGLILATKCHDPAGKDQTLLIDIDLSILGSDSATFEAYDLAIRREYAWVPDSDYRTGRAAILRKFLDRSRIFQTTALHDLFEQPARDNLQRKLDELRA